MCFVTKKKYEDMLAILVARNSNLNNKIDSVIDEITQISGKLSDIFGRLKELENPQETEEPVEVAIFNPKDYESRADYPTEIAGYQVGYIQLSVGAPLCIRGKDNVLTAYENPEWGSGTAAKRIIAKAGRILAVYCPKYADWKDMIDLHFSEPYPFKFDGGTRAYRLMDEQTVDGRNLWELGEVLFVDASNVGGAWMP